MGEIQQICIFVTEHRLKDRAQPLPPQSNFHPIRIIDRSWSGSVQCLALQGPCRVLSLWLLSVIICLISITDRVSN